MVDKVLESAKSKQIMAARWTRTRRWVQKIKRNHENIFMGLIQGASVAGSYINDKYLY